LSLLRWYQVVFLEEPLEVEVGEGQVAQDADALDHELLRVGALFEKQESIF
jgi:hypothetical protein